MLGQRGVSLVEIVVAAGIAATLLGMVWLAEPLLAHVALRSAAATLVTDLRLAQARALAERDPDRRHGLEFRLPDRRYLVFTREGRTTTVIRERSLPARVRLMYARFGGGTPSTVVFTGVSLFGAPSGGGTVTLSTGSARLCIRVIPATGRIRVSNIGCP